MLLATLLALAAQTGDPQIKTDHPWYPGELACSTFERLFAHQAEIYTRVTGRDVKSDEDKALASWLWRNTHYAHADEGKMDYWGQGFGKGDDRTRDYWTGLIAHGHGLCGTTHSQWTAEFEYLLGHGRGRGMGVDGHNSFEVWLTGGPYGAGKWVLLDHDISTVIYNDEGTALVSIPEVKAKLKEYSDPRYKPQKQHGWIVAGLHPSDAKGVFSGYHTAEYLAGYAGAPPMIHLRRGETFRRHLQPGLDDGKTFVFWGLNYNAGGIPGPQRDRTWVNQPDVMYKATREAPYNVGQFRYGNAVYVYRPEATTYKDAVVDESATHVTFEFNTPYVIAATPPNDKEWGIYDAGGRNGLVLRGGPAGCPVSVSLDHGKTWKEGGPLRDGLDLTDLVKGRKGYWIRFGTAAPALAGLSITTVCQANPAVMPRLKDGGSTVTYEASGRALASVGPNLDQAAARVVDGAFGSRTVTLEVAAPRKAPVVGLYAVAHIASSNPPDPAVKYQIDASTDGGKTWSAVVKDWSIPRRGEEPKGFWSQSFCYGYVDLKAEGPVLVRFANTGGKSYLRAETHLVYKTELKPVKVTFAWTDDRGERTESRVFPGAGPWKIPTGKGVVTRRVDFEPVN
ncbi:MAG TPA: hypothetical protein VEJ18_08570 [Planctomycetota bacterium]|nr:hypothetical protein [Planctomycetota bacterium]